MGMKKKVKSRSMFNRERNKERQESATQSNEQKTRDTSIAVALPLSVIVPPAADRRSVYLFLRLSKSWRSTFSTRFCGDQEILWKRTYYCLILLNTGKQTKW